MKLHLIILIWSLVYLFAVFQYFVHETGNEYSSSGKKHNVFQRYIHGLTLVSGGILYVLKRAAVLLIVTGIPTAIIYMAIK